MLGAIAGGWFGGGIAKATLPEGRVREIARQLAPLEGAAFGVAKSELHKTRRLDALIEDITEMTPREMRKAKDYARQQPREERAKIMDAVRDLTAANERREQQEKHAAEHRSNQDQQRASERRDARAIGLGGGKNGGKGK